MYCRICGDALFEEDHDDLRDNEVSYLCSECEIIFVYERGEDDAELKEIGFIFV